MLTLSSAESKLVLSTLSKRRTWLLKAMEEKNLPPGTRNEYLESAQALDSAMKKIAQSTPKPPNKSKTTPTNPTRKLTLETARVLVAEDNPDSSQLILDILDDFGMKQVVLAKDGIEAFDMIKGAKAPYDLILCDWDMPGLSGLEVHGRAKASNTLRNAHFIMVTAVSESARIREAIQQGVDDYIVKPIDIDVLENKIRSALQINAEPKKEENKDSPSS